MGCDELASQFACEVKPGIYVDRMHLLPGLFAYCEHVVGLAPHRGSAVNEVCHPSDGRLCVSHQRIACGATCEIADPGHSQVRPGRGFSRSSDRILVHVGEHRSHAFADQGLRDGTADAISRTGDQSCLAGGVEWSVQQAHVDRSSQKDIA